MRDESATYYARPLLQRFAGNMLQLGLGWLAAGMLVATAMVPPRGHSLDGPLEKVFGACALTLMVAGLVTLLASSYGCGDLGNLGWLSATATVVDVIALVAGGAYVGLMKGNGLAWGIYAATVAVVILWAWWARRWTRIVRR